MIAVEIQLWWADLRSADPSLEDLLDETERARLDRFERPADRGRSLVAAALLRIAVGARLGIEPRLVGIDRTCADCGRPHGRPVVTGPNNAPGSASLSAASAAPPGGPTPYVSVSHSGLLIVVAIADGPVGVDVQRIADLEPGRDAAAWVAREAEVKLGRDGATLHPVSPPLPGYAATLATPPGPTVTIESIAWSISGAG